MSFRVQVMLIWSITMLRQFVVAEQTNAGPLEITLLCHSPLHLLSAIPSHPQQFITLTPN